MKDKRMTTQVQRTNSKSTKTTLLVTLVGLMVLVAAVVGGWNYYTNRYPSWYEEVRLSDGRIITIHQKREYYDNYGTNQSWVEIDLPELGGKQVWRSYLMPMRVDVVQGSVYVYGRPRGPRQLEYYRYPKNHMVAFKWSGETFARLPFTQVPDAIKQEENVFSCVPEQHSRPLHLEAKDKQWCPPSGDKGQFVRRIDLVAYKALGDEMASLANWTLRSE